MCHFITFVVPSADSEAFAEVVKAHGRRAQPVNSPALAKVMLPDERQFVGPARGCDCSTVLGAEQSEWDADAFEGRERERLRRKGWGASKVERALEDRRASITCVERT